MRLRILDALRSAPRCVSELSESLDLEVVTVSHHLGILHAVGLLEREKKGPFQGLSLARGSFGPRQRASDKQHIDLGCCRLEIPPAAASVPMAAARWAILVRLKSRCTRRHPR